MTRHWARFARLTLVLALLFIARSGWAIDRELVASMALSSELLPSRVCVHAAKVLAPLPKPSEPTPSLQTIAPGQVLFVGSATPACVASTEQCNSCEAVQENSGGTMCWLSPAANKGDEPVRDLQLELVGAALRSFRVEGTDVVLQVELGSAPSVRLRSLGGGYFPSFAHVFSVSGALQLALRNRCVEKQLSYSTDPDPDPADNAGVSLKAEVTTSRNSKKRVHHPGGTVLLEVPEEGGITTVMLKRGDSEYTGNFSYPSTGPVALLATAFSFTWRKSAFVKDRRDLLASWADRIQNAAQKAKRKAEDDSRECPRAWLVREGVECKLKPAQEKPAQEECRYACDLRGTINEFAKFPLRVRFELAPPRFVPLEPGLSWEEDLRFPNADFSSLPPADQRRIYLVWPQEKSTPGKEWESFELTGADEKTHRLEKATNSLPVEGLQSPATFVLRYVGRGPYRSTTLRAYGDILVIPEPSHVRRAAVLGVNAHGGVLVHPSLVARQLSATADAEIQALIATRWEVWLSGTITKHPSELKVEGQALTSNSALQARVLVGGGFRIRPSNVCYLDVGLGLGIATRVRDSDWSRSRLQFASALRARFGYDLTRAVAVEPFVTLWLPETYLKQVQDSAGPRAPEIRRSASLGLGLGLSWADVF